LLTEDEARRIAANVAKLPQKESQVRCRGFSLRLLQSVFISLRTQHGENITEHVPHQKNNYSNGRENWGNQWHFRFIVVAAL
jgi:hypothetical protein